jgi:hypothetical protein
MKFKALNQAVAFIHNQMRTTGERVHTEKWQSVEVKNNPAAEMVEILNLSFSCPMNLSIPDLQLQLNPNLPWANHHFEERMCGYPINPGVEWANWPWAGKAEESLDNGIFNHNYMERYWPKNAGYIRSPTSDAADWIEKSGNNYSRGERPVALPSNRGIRHKYGDLGDVVQLLAEEPLTRQAYLPIWFPEDTGYQNKGRKPCSLGYHFIMRNNKLHIRYDIRSCDLYRHFDDDIYMTILLAHRVLEMLETNPLWSEVELGDFTMNITSLHMFVSDFQVLYKRSPR